MKVAKFAIILVLMLGIAAPAQADEGRTLYICGEETVAAAAHRFGCEADLLAAMNGVAEDAVLAAGSCLYLPEDPPQTAQPQQNSTVEVQAGDTLYKLAQRHGTTVAALAELNGIGNINLIRAGQQLLLPAAAAGGGAAVSGATHSAYLQKAAGAAYLLPQNQLLLLSWPLQGSISSKFGSRSSGYHHGLDIAAPKGTAINAVAEGEVVFSGWLNAAYGYAVKLRHADGVETLYAHASKLKVRQGDVVSQGQKIAEVGKSGNATGYHLHLELRLNGKAVDVLPFLPE